MDASSNVDPTVDEIFRNYDGYDFDTAQRYFDIVRQGREECPVVHSEAHGGYWIINNHADVRAVLSDPETFSNANGIVIPVEDRLRKPPQDLDPPLQNEFRRLLNRYFSRVGLGRHESAIKEIARSHVEGFLSLGDRASGGAGGDVVERLARPLTAEILGTVILDLDDQEAFAELCSRVAAVARGSAEENARAFTQLQDCVTTLLDDMLNRERRDDVVDAVLNGTVDGRPLTEDERVGTMMQLFLGGLKTSVAAIANIVCHIARSPELEQRLARPGWEKQELDEFLRFEPPVKMLGRTVTQDVTLGNQFIRAGESVAVMLGSANRDDAVFPEADQLCQDRDRNPHLSFGLGVHRCIGSNLARMIITATVDALLARVSNIDICDGEVLIREASSMEVGWERLPVMFDVQSILGRRAPSWQS